MAGLAVRLTTVFCGSAPYEVRHPSGEVRACGRFELEQICDNDVNELLYLADSRRGDWVPLKFGKPRTLKAYR